MISCSQWGMFPLPQPKFSRAWYDEQRRVEAPPMTYYDLQLLHGYQHQSDFR